MSEVKHIDIVAFRREGYLQELNRRFLHPLGLALEVVVGEDGSERLGGVWDCRDDPEGLYYPDDDLATKALNIDRLWTERANARTTALGWMVQPT